MKYTQLILFILRKKVDSIYIHSLDAWVKYCEVFHMGPHITQKCKNRMAVVVIVKFLDPNRQCLLFAIYLPDISVIYNFLVLNNSNL